MNREDIIRMAQEAGWKDLRNYDSEMNEFLVMGDFKDLQRFATLVASAEREACVKIVESEAIQYAEPVWAFEIVNDIKARGQA